MERVGVAVGSAVDEAGEASEVPRLPAGDDLVEAEMENGLARGIGATVRRGRVVAARRRQVRQIIVAARGEARRRP